MKFYILTYIYINNIYIVLLKNYSALSDNIYIVNIID